MALEKTGVQLVVQGEPQAVKALDSYNAALKTLQKASTGAAKLPAVNVGGIGNKIPQLANAFQGLTNQVLASNPALASVTSQIQGLGAMTPTAIAGVAGLAVAFVGIAASAKAFYELGQRGAALEPILSAFGNIVSGAGDSTQALNTLREQTRGTISDVELMRLTVASLKGTTSTFRSVVSKDLGTIIDLTGRIAQASGDSADVVREKFLLGLRRQSVKLVDDVGVLVAADKAYAEYAKSIGVATNALTDQQKQAAFAQEAIKQLKVIGAEIGSPAQTLENLKTPLVVITNLLDKLALSVQPLFAPMTKFIADAAMGFQNLASNVLPLVQASFAVLGQVFTSFVKVGQAVFDALFGDIFRVANIALPYLVAAAQIAADGVIAAVQTLGNIATGIVSQFSSIFPGLSSITEQSFSQLVANVSRGGGNITGAFAAGLLSGGTKVVDAATQIAQLVADFLEGFSPPKKGPLSKIDEGGRNVALAWAEGFRGAALPSIEKVTAAVNAELGAIGKFSLQAVTDRLAQLDAALQPFNDQLTIAKATFEQIAGFVDPALKAIDRQLERAVKMGDAGAARALDNQAQSLKSIRNQEQARLDAIQVQQSLAETAQAQERALLGIQQKRLGTVEAIAQATSGAVGAADKLSSEKEAKAPKGSGEAAKAVEESTGGFTPGKAPDLVSSEAVNNARKLITESFAGGLQDSGYAEAVAKFSGSTGKLNTQLDRIKSAAPGSALKKKLDPAITAFDDFKNAIANAQTAIDNTLSGLATTFTTYFGEEGSIVAPLKILFAADGLFGEQGTIATAIAGLFGEEGKLPLAFATIQTDATTFVNNLTLTLGGIPIAFTDLMITPLTTAKDTMQTIINDILDAFTTFASGDLGLSQLGAGLTTYFVDPVKSAANAALQALEDAINNIYDGLPGVIKTGLAQLGFEGRIDIPGLATGATGFKGMAMVGEKGPELVNFGSKANIFPANLSRQIMQGISSPPPIVVENGGGRGGGSTYNNQRTMNSTFNVGSGNQARLLERRRAAFYGF